MSDFGVRQLDLTATFSSAFRTTPVVTVGLMKLDHFESDDDASMSLQSLLEQMQAEMKQLQAEIEAQDQIFQAEIQQLQAKDQMYQADIQQLQTEMAANDQRIQDLEQRDYVERCESGDLESPTNVFTSGDGYRYLDVTATFSRAFRTTPVVTVGLRSLDHYAGHIRVRASLASVSTTSLTVRISTWSSSQLYYANVNWLACA
uniref:H-type lectin domain-containing protein n=1 Tax=Branchiostoma floridae TaxID=7739 RepID=C3XSY8_BRAFL|eukprot:XP_002612847.1 hypothetical protein BRAFLDRAFT_67203 [Branchiostoma floridae]